jgi:CBS-domain-containing membrane protein
MSATLIPLLDLTAGDLMSRDVIGLSADMHLCEAAELLLQNHIGGAPVVDSSGKCIGVLSAVDILRLSDTRALTTASLPRSCSFQAKVRTAEGREVIQCTLPPGVCPIQGKQTGPDGRDITVCREPHCVLADWQVVDVERLPNDAVRRFMTANPVTAGTAAAISILARMMIDAHIHRIIIVDREGKPIGVVSSSDLLAALAREKEQGPTTAIEARETSYAFPKTS